MGFFQINAILPLRWDAIARVLRLSGNAVAGSAILTAAGAAAAPPVHWENTECAAGERTEARESGSAEFSVVALESCEELPAHYQGLRQLSTESIEANPFYEPWLLVPAIRHLMDSVPKLQLILIYKSNILCAFLPFLEQRSYRGLPTRTLIALRHNYFALTNPLLHHRWGQQALEYFLTRWLAENKKFGLVVFPMLATDGSFHGILYQTAFAGDLLTHVDRRFTRGLYRCSVSNKVFQPLSGRFRKHTRRAMEKLESMGTVTYCELNRENAEQWLEEFLELEKSGWKGRKGSALASSPASRQFFLDCARNGVANGVFTGSALRLDGRMIAARTLVSSQDGSFLFKIAYDEEFASFSPGTLLEIRAMQEGLPPTIRWIDAATMPTSNVYQRLWTETRTIETVLIANRTAYAEFCLTLLPLLRWVKRRFAAIFPRLASRR